MPTTTLTQATILEDQRHGLGNLVLRVEGEEGPCVLKLYRRRWPRWQERSEQLVSRLFLGKTGGNASDRYRAERVNIGVWRDHGFAVPAILDRPLPADVEPPALWFEFCEGPLLLDVVQNPGVPWERKRFLLAALAADLGCRHATARERSEMRLVQKHGTLEHVIVGSTGDQGTCRLVTIDHEGHYLPGYPLHEALARELSGYLRSIAKSAGERIDEAFETFVASYDRPALLHDVATWAVRGRSVKRYLTRWRDRRKRQRHGKTEVMARVLSLL